MHFMGADCVLGSDFPLLQRMNKKERRMMITEVMKMVLCMKFCVFFMEPGCMQHAHKNEKIMIMMIMQMR